MSASPARAIAFDVLLRVAKKDAYADDELRTKLDPSVKGEDAGLATELVMGALRWQRLLDFAVDRFSKKRVSSFDAEVAIALRLGAYQLLFLDRVPARAAVHESVELVKRAKKTSAATLVNAILRKVAGTAPATGARRESLTTTIPKNLPEGDRLGILHSHPAWIVDRWLRVYGSERTEALFDSNNRAPATSGYLLSAEHADEATQPLVQTGCSVSPGRLLRDALLFEGGNPGACEAVRRGWVALQDEASQAVARLLSVDPGNSVLDLCIGRVPNFLDRRSEGALRPAKPHPGERPIPGARLRRPPDFRLRTARHRAAAAPATRCNPSARAAASLRRRAPR